MNKLLTIDDLSVRWQVSKSTIRNYIASGKLTKVELLNDTRFSLSYIEAIENQTEGPKSFREICLEKELDKLKVENQRLVAKIGQVIGDLSGELIRV